MKLMKTSPENGILGVIKSSISKMPIILCLKREVTPTLTYNLRILNYNSEVCVY